MNIAEYKLELVNYILNSPNERIMAIYNSLLNNKSDEDFWDLLSANQKQNLKKGIEDLNKGKKHDAFEVLEEIENE
ncbi:MAG: hypothetical protein JXL97_10085 [Bacteroidales bacterium]|nr:hypothetical protein [Bacteroidales bacterium]